MATSYTSEALALAVDQVREGVPLSDLNKFNPLIDIVAKTHKKLGFDVPFRMPGEVNGKLAPSSTGGGYNFTFPLRVSEAGITKFLASKSSLVDPLPVDNTMRSTFPVRICITPVAIYDLDVNAIRGKEAICDYMVEKAMEALQDHVNTLCGTRGSYMWATSDSATTFSPLPHIIYAAAAGSQSELGGITNTTYTKDSNQYLTTANFASLGVMALGQLLAKIHGVGGKPSCIITDDFGYSMYLGATKANRMVSHFSDDLWGDSYGDIMGIPVLIDSQCYTATAGTTANFYFLDLRYLGWYVLQYVDEENRPAFCLPMKEVKLANQLGKVVAVVTEGNLCCWLRPPQGLYAASTYGT